MNRDEKKIIIDDIAEKLGQYPNIYVTDISTLTVEKTNDLRRQCFNRGIEIRVAKNTLIEKAMLQKGANFEELIGTLKGSTALMFSEIGNVPAKLIKEFRRKNERPILKGALIGEDTYVGDNQIDTIANIKSREELIGDIIGMLQAPARNIISALQNREGFGPEAETESAE